MQGQRGMFTFRCFSGSRHGHLRAGFIREGDDWHSLLMDAIEAPSDRKSQLLTINHHDSYCKVVRVTT